MARLTLVQHKGLWVVSARNLYAFLEDAKGEKVFQFVDWCASQSIAERGKEYFIPESSRGLPDVLLSHYYAMCICLIYKSGRYREAIDTLNSLKVITY